MCQALGKDCPKDLVKSLSKEELLELLQEIGMLERAVCPQVGSNASGSKPRCRSRPQTGGMVHASARDKQRKQSCHQPLQEKVQGINEVCLGDTQSLVDRNLSLDTPPQDAQKEDGLAEHATLGQTRRVVSGVQRTMGQSHHVDPCELRAQILEEAVLNNMAFFETARLLAEQGLPPPEMGELKKIQIQTQREKAKLAEEERQRQSELCAKFERAQKERAAASASIREQLKSNKKTTRYLDGQPVQLQRGETRMLVKQEEAKILSKEACAVSIRIIGSKNYTKPAHDQKKKGPRSS